MLSNVEATMLTPVLDLSTNIASESPTSTAAPAVTEPVVTVYPPRRPNIFSKRRPQRNVGWSAETLVTIPSHATGGAGSDDGLTKEELEEFQAAGQAKMARKTEGFLRMASRHNWRPRVVEDLGEAFAIED